jgi:hypothetical protein
MLPRSEGYRVAGDAWLTASPRTKQSLSALNVALQMQYDLWHAEHSTEAGRIAVKPLKGRRAA